MHMVVSRIEGVGTMSQHVIAKAQGHIPNGLAKIERSLISSGGAKTSIEIFRETPVRRHESVLLMTVRCEIALEHVPREPATTYAGIDRAAFPIPDPYSVTLYLPAVSRERLLDRRNP